MSVYGLSDGGSSADRPLSVENTLLASYSDVATSDNSATVSAMYFQAARMDTQARKSSNYKPKPCTDIDKHMACMGGAASGDPCLKRVLRNSKNHGRAIVCTKCDKDIVQCEQVCAKIDVHLSISVCSCWSCSAEALCTGGALSKALRVHTSSPRHHGHAHSALHLASLYRVSQLPPTLLQLKMLLPKKKPLASLTSLTTNSWCTPHKRH